MGKVAVEGTWNSESAKATARALSKGHNGSRAPQIWEMRPEEYRVYIFTVGHTDRLSTTHALLGRINVPGCKPDERYKLVTSVRHPFPQRIEDILLSDPNDDPYRYHDAKRIAQDICNPSNPFLDQKIDDYGKLDPYFAVQDGTNFSRFGVFWTLNQTPTEEELANAEKRRDAFYKNTISEHDRLYAAKPANAANFGPDVRMALDYFGEQRDYHRKFIPVQTCPNCGTQIPASAGFHFMPNGACCVNDWDKAIAAGVKTKKDRPDGRRDTPEAA